MEDGVDFIDPIRPLHVNVMLLFLFRESSFFGVVHSRFFDGHLDFAGEGLGNLPKEMHHDAESRFVDAGAALVVLSRVFVSEGMESYIKCACGFEEGTPIGGEDVFVAHLRSDLAEGLIKTEYSISFEGREFMVIKKHPWHDADAYILYDREGVFVRDGTERVGDVFLGEGFYDRLQSIGPPFREVSIEGVERRLRVGYVWRIKSGRSMDSRSMDLLP